MESFIIRAAFIACVCFIPDVTTAELRITVRVDHVECAREFLGEIGAKFTDDMQSIVLEDIHAFWILENVWAAREDKNAYARPKVAYRSGDRVPVRFKMCRFKQTKTKAWQSERGFSATLIPSLLDSKRVRVTMEQLQRHCIELTSSVIQSGRTVAFVIDQQPNAVRLLLVTPRIHKF